MKRLLLVSAIALASVPAAAQFQKPEDAIKYRQSAFTVMANHFGRVAAMAQGRVPFDAKVAADNTAIVMTMSKLPYAGFGDGTDKGLPNRAKPEIWKEQAKFNDLASKMQAEVVKLDAAAKSGSLDALKAAVGATGGSCKACHDDFRAEKYSN
ncbi:cytochrome c [Aquincola sp. S2]|uniref:Cytochrome c n=1 Tax=Pseudaquabacterium terrae TaxID=2732868 RepID=A0ABX2EM23_9BURK|nr:cytochrome c [Aquabacterium terrae]NRF69661.1 cytochrome c [Aquabacterium terrae]